MKIFENEKYEINIINGGNFRLDGGAMFGVVPKVIWSKLIDVNEKNQIPLSTNALVVKLKKSNKLLLIETGNGNKFSEKFKKIYEIEDNDIERALLKNGFSPSDLTHVILTHLHFDHAGGSTKIEDGRTVPTFKNAKYFIQKREWEEATHPNDRNRASYLPENFVPLMEMGVLNLVDGENEILEGIKVIPTPGHTFGHQSVLIDTGNEKFFYCGDLVPTNRHVPIPFIMAYDLYPVTIIETKKKIYEMGLKENWTFIFLHDPDSPVGKIFLDEKGKYRFKKI